VLTWDSTQPARTRLWGRRGQADAGSVPEKGRQQGGRGGEARLALPAAS